ncbi:hypothetical protein C8Q76DRAFT_144958 [Earliella scabrosa]|nr:hypothetical protein C8Q76DRAFT_144958 [Earliella scabrosa]
MQKSLLHRLPNELVVRIIFQLDMADLLAAKRVCRLCKELIETDLYLLYKVELAANGMLDGFQSGLSVRERLEKLVEYRTRIRSGAQVNVENNWFASDDASLSSLLLGSSPSYHHQTTNKCTIYSPPCAAGHPTGRQWSLEPSHTYNSSTLVVAADIAQDLVVVSQFLNVTKNFAIRFLSLARVGAPHPYAAQPEIMVDLPIDTHHHYGAAVGLSQTQILGSYVALAWDDRLVPTPFPSPSYVQVWEWKTGKLVWHRSYGSRVSVSILNASHLMVVSQSEKSISVYQIPAASPTSPSNGSGLGLVLQLPPIENIKAAWISESSHPAPGGAPFSPDPSLQPTVVTLASLKFVGGRMTAIHVTLLIPLATIRRHLEEVSRPTEEGLPRSMRITWSQWGPNGCIMLHVPQQPHNPIEGPMGIHPCGSRVAFVCHDESNPEHAPVRIYDLNPWARLRPCDPRQEETLTSLEDPKTYEHVFWPSERPPHVPRVVYGGFSVDIPPGSRLSGIAMCRNGFIVSTTGQRAQSFGYQTYLF